VRSVLIVDDDIALRAALKLALETRGYEVRVAANAREALGLQRTRPAELLVTDIFMPDGDGFEALDAFRKEFPATKVMVMSGDAKRVKGDYLAAALLAGADETIAKPFQMHTLMEALDRLRP